MRQPWLSIVIPTAGQRSQGLQRTLDSINRQKRSAAVEVLVVGDTHERSDFSDIQALVETAGGSWLEFDGGLHCVGQPQRTFGARQARGEWVGFSQDDNILTETALSQIWAALCQEPRQRPLFFRVHMPWGECVWQAPHLYQDNIDADCLVLPRALAREVTWGLRYQGDFDAAVDAMQRAGGDVGWREEEIAISRPAEGDIWWS